MGKLNVRVEFLWALVLTACLLLMFLYWEEVQAHDIIIDNSVTNNYYGDDVGVGPMTITGAEDLAAAALTQAYASGAHELDWSTTDLQLSVTYAIQVDGEEEDAYSIKLGKKEIFGDKFLPQTMFHITLNPEVEGLGNTLVFGGTVRIK